jgi:GAF domain-containing protein
MPLPDAASGDLSRILLSEESLESILDKVTSLAERSIPGTEAVSITLLRPAGPITAASSGHLATAADELQYGADEGPCLDAARLNVIRVVDDMTTDDRWPTYGPHAAAAGVRSSLSVPLGVKDRTVGAMNIYACGRDAFDDSAIEAAEGFAGHAAVAITNAELYLTTVELARQLNVALETRGVIEQAKGILMARQGCTADDAFAILKERSQHENVKLRDVAARVVAEVHD